MTGDPEGRRQLRRGPEPLYHQLEQAIRDLMAAGEVKEGDRLPSEHELCRQYGLSRSTVRRAIENLAREGVLRSVTGRGTFVVARRVPLSARFPSVSSAVESVGVRAGSRILERRRSAADNEIASLLRVPEGTEVLRLTRLRLAEDEAIAYTVSHLPFEPIGRVLIENGDVDSFYRVLSEQLGLVIVPGPQRFQVARADDYDASVLEIQPGSPLLYSWAVDEDQFGRPFEYVKAFYRADRFAFEVPRGGRALAISSDPERLAAQAGRS